jgi:radical SAM superfamily enzyme YgiQ (UPF0313 family)
MKVVVANPPWPGKGYGARSNVRWPHRRADKRLPFPIYLAYATSVLKEAGFKTTGIDAVWEDLGIRSFARKIKEINPRVVLIEACTPSIAYDLESAEAIKDELEDAVVVFCGPHATYFHKKIIENYGFVDVCIRGEFELAFRDICKAVKRKRGLSSVKGITYRDSKKNVRVNMDRPLIEDLDRLPYPDRKEFPIERYQQAFYAGKNTALIVSTRGCPFQCTYCLWPSTLTHRRYRIRDPRKVVDEIEHLIKREGIDELFFDEDEFTVSKNKVIELCNEIIKRGIKIKWHCMGRVNVVDENVLRLMKKAGCYQIFYRFESGSEKILKSVKKGITKDQIRNAVKLTKKAGIVCCGSFILGSPDEDWSTLKETMKFATSLGADWVQFSPCIPYPGTPMYEETKQLGLLEVESWDDFGGGNDFVIRTKHLSKEELSGFMRKAYKSYYTSPRVIWTNLKSMKNREQARRVMRSLRSVMMRAFYYNK